jgi:hypothetical protein
MIGKPPRYSLSQSEFPYRSLAALAGRAPIGGTREVALATLVAARLASSAVGPGLLPTSTRVARARSARNWLLSMSLPQNARNAVLRVIVASGDDNMEELQQSLAKLMELTDGQLDQASRMELGRLMKRMAPDATEAAERPEPQPK